VGKKSKRRRDGLTKDQRIARHAKLRATTLKIWNDQGGKCYWCGLQVWRKSLSADHLRLRSQGGGDDEDNIVAAHSICNNMRGDMTPLQFAQSGKLAEAYEKVKIELAERERRERDDAVFARLDEEMGG